MATNISEILNAPRAKRITITNLARQEGVAPCTVHRWATKGIQGICLPTAKVGFKRVTTRAVFLARLRGIVAGVSSAPVNRSSIGMTLNP